MILVVDDEPEITKHILDYLLDHNIQAKATCFPEEALILAKKESYRCIIADIAMPRINGIELSKSIREIDPQIKIICVSGFAEMMLPDLEAIKVDFFLQKPFAPRDLIKCVKECLRAA